MCINSEIVVFNPIVEPDEITWLHTVSGVLLHFFGVSCNVSFSLSIIFSSASIYLGPVTKKKRKLINLLHC